MNNINNEMIKIIGRKKVYSTSFLTGMPQKDQGMTQRDPPDYKTVQKCVFRRFSRKKLY